MRPKGCPSNDAGKDNIMWEALPRDEGHALWRGGWRCRWFGWGWGWENGRFPSPALFHYNGEQAGAKGSRHRPNWLNAPKMRNSQKHGDEQVRLCKFYYPLIFVKNIGELFWHTCCVGMSFNMICESMIDTIPSDEFATAIEAHINWAAVWDGALDHNAFFGVWADLQREEADSVERESGAGSLAPDPARTS